jgi:hypothetical protein
MGLSRTAAGGDKAMKQAGAHLPADGLFDLRAVLQPWDLDASAGRHASAGEAGEPDAVLQASAVESDTEGSGAAPLTVAASKGVGVSLSAGFVAWLLRAGPLVAGLASSMPAWKGFDPLPVLARERRARADPQGGDTEEGLEKGPEAEAEVEALFGAAEASRPRQVTRARTEQTR